MGLEKLARELEETARQSAAMAEGVAAGLAILSDPLRDEESARAEAADRIVRALQMQDRIDQRCRNLARAARALAGTPPGGAHETVWIALELDELRADRHARTTREIEPGEIELF